MKHQKAVHSVKAGNQSLQISMFPQILRKMDRNAIFLTQFGMIFKAKIVHLLARLVLYLHIFACLFFYNRNRVILDIVLQCISLNQSIYHGYLSK